MKLEECIFTRLNESFDLKSFDCTNSDLNEFLQEDALKDMSELIGVTHVFYHPDKPNSIVGFFTVSNDLLPLEIASNNIQRKTKKLIPRAKHKRSYPSVKIGRLGVHKDYQGDGFAYDLMLFIKGWFIENNKTGCRYLLVDAYNQTRVLNYYSKCDFQFLLNEDSEKSIFEKRLDENGSLKTRLMFFDLINLVR